MGGLWEAGEVVQYDKEQLPTLLTEKGTLYPLLSIRRIVLLK